MERNEVISYLKRYRHIDLEIKAKKQQLEKLNLIKTDIKAINYDEKIKGVSNVDSLEQSVVKVVDLERDINASVKKSLEVKTDIICSINKLKNSKFNTILTLKYINGDTWEDIAENMNYSLSNVHKIHNKAISILSGLI